MHHSEPLHLSFLGFFPVQCTPFMSVSSILEEALFPEGEKKKSKIQKKILQTGSSLTPLLKRVSKLQHGKFQADFEEKGKKPSP